jgi:hypothetical protein
MMVILVNDDPFGNNVRVTDSNAGGSTIFNGYIPAQGEQSLICQANDSDHGEIITYQDNNPGITRSFLTEGERISL